MDEIKFTLHNPLTEEEWDMITDVDFDHTPEITFHTKHGKEVVFVKRKTGKWIEDAETYYKTVNEKGGGVNENTSYFTDDIACSECLAMFSVIDNETEHWNFCPNCGAKMEDET